MVSLAEVGVLLLDEDHLFRRELDLLLGRPLQLKPPLIARAQALFAEDVLYGEGKLTEITSSLSGALMRLHPHAG